MNKTISNKALKYAAGLLLAVLMLACLPLMNAQAGTITISASSATLYLKGGSKSIHLHVYDDGQQVSANWKSSKKKVAKVSSSGLVTARKKGTATVSASVNGVKITCRVSVKKTPTAYAKAVSAYKSFLKRSYVVYTGSGARDQADNFYLIDLDKNGVPELLVCVVADNGDHYYVLYNYNDGQISTGQRLGVASDFVWFKGAGVMAYRETQKNQSLYFYSRYNGTTLNSLAIVRYKSGTNTYYKSDGAIGDYGQKLSAIKFRVYVDHDLLGYGAKKRVTAHVNNMANRSHYLR